MVCWEAETGRARTARVRLFSAGLLCLEVALRSARLLMPLSGRPSTTNRFSAAVGALIGGVDAAAFEACSAPDSPTAIYHSASCQTSAQARGSLHLGWALRTTDQDRGERIAAGEGRLLALAWSSAPRPS
jgi:hypothetical protein